LSADVLNIMTNVSLAQAQECILEKSLIDNKKSTITAKVALQIVEYYQLVLKIIQQMRSDAFATDIVEKLVSHKSRIQLF